MPNVPKDPWKNQTGNLVDLSSGCLTYVAPKPDEDRLLAGLAGLGVWTVRGDSDQWEQLGTGKDSAQIDNLATAFKFDPEDSNTFYEGGIYGTGIFKTTDNGKTFTVVGGFHVERFDVDFTDPDRKTILTTTHESQGVNITRNAGESWEDITATLPKDSGLCVSVLVLDSDNYLLGCVGGIYRTEDGASSWKRVIEGSAFPDPFIASTGAIYWTVGDAGLAKSTDKGKTWKKVGPESLTRGLFLELPDGRIAAAGWDYVVVSDDEGKTWTPASSPYPSMWEWATGLFYSASRKAFYYMHNQCGEKLRDKALTYYPFDTEK